MNNEDASLLIKLIEMDEMVTLQQQLDQEIGPVILINKFNVKPEEVDQLLAAWTADAAFFKRQPGFISAQLHRGVGGSCVFINYAVLGVGRALPVGVQPARVPRGDEGVSAEHDDIAAPIPEGRCVEHLRGLSDG